MVSHRSGCRRVQRINGSDGSTMGGVHDPAPQFCRLRFFIPSEKREGLYPAGKKLLRALQLGHCCSQIITIKCIDHLLPRRLYVGSRRLLRWS